MFFFLMSACLFRLASVHLLKPIQYLLIFSSFRFLVVFFLLRGKKNVPSRARENQPYSQCRKSTIFPLGFGIISGYIQFQDISILHILRFNPLFCNILLSIFKILGTTIQLESTLHYHALAISPLEMLVAKSEML